MANALPYAMAAQVAATYGLTFQPGTNQLWAVVNERDEIGPDLVPDYLTSVRPGAFYGWPYSYWGRHVDPRVKPERPDMVACDAHGGHICSLDLSTDRTGEHVLPAHA